MVDAPNDDDHVRVDSLEYASFLDQTHGFIVRNIETINQIALDYAKIAPGQKPAYIGMFLVLYSLASAILNALPVPYRMSENIIIIVLLVGVFALIAGSSIEMFSFHRKLKMLEQKEVEIREDLRNNERRRESLFGAMFKSGK